MHEGDQAFSSNKGKQIIYGAEEVVWYPQPLHSQKNQHPSNWNSVQY